MNGQTNNSVNSQNGASVNGQNSSTVDVQPTNRKDEFLNDLMSIWDKYLVYRNEDLAEYMYKFPMFV
jgi:hypothetical protein